MTMRASIILLCYKMADQIGNTLRSLVSPYQKNVSGSEIEILLVDNGSPTPMGEIPWSPVRILAICIFRLPKLGRALPKR